MRKAHKQVMHPYKGVVFHLHIAITRIQTLKNSDSLNADWYPFIISKRNYFLHISYFHLSNIKTIIYNKNETLLQNMRAETTLLLLHSVCPCEPHIIHCKFLCNLRKWRDDEMICFKNIISQTYGVMVWEVWLHSYI